MAEKKEVDKDIQILGKFVRIYCEDNHNCKQELCTDCSELLNYAAKRRQLCPLDPKPECKACHIHCHKPEYREKIREVMRYSGKRFLRTIFK